MEAGKGQNLEPLRVREPQESLWFCCGLDVFLWHHVACGKDAKMERSVLSRSPQTKSTAGIAEEGAADMAALIAELHDLASIQLDAAHRSTDRADSGRVRGMPQAVMHASSPKMVICGPWDHTACDIPGASAMRRPERSEQPLFLVVMMTR